MKKDFMSKLLGFLICIFFFSASAFAQSTSFNSETVTFHFSEINYEVVCLKNIVNISDIKVSSSKDIEQLEYSLDGGISWAVLTPLNSYREVNFNLPEVSFDSGLLVFKVRVLVDGIMYTSIDKYIPTSCGESLILGYYFENKDEPAIITESGDILYNPNHKLKVVVETSYAISDVKIFSDEKSASLIYDYSAKLWSVEIPEDFLSKSANLLEIVGHSEGDLVKKTLPDIFNTSFYVPNLENVKNGYEVYYFNDYQWRLLNYSDDEVIYPIFTLLPGKYYIRFQRQHGWYQSTIFEINEKSVLALNSIDSDYPFFLQWFEKYLTALDVVIFDSSFSSVEGLVKQEGGDLKEYIDENARDSLIMYVNRWNPWYRQALKALELFVDDYNVILISDQNNFSSLSLGLNERLENMDIYEINDTFLLRNYLAYQPQIVYYSFEEDSFYSIRSLQSLADLNNLLNNLGLE